MTEIGYQYIHFHFSEKWVPIYSFCDYFFEYIGLWVCDDFGVADSFTKLGPWFEILSELVLKAWRDGLPLSLNWFHTFGQIYQIVKSLVFYSVISNSAREWEPI